MYKRQVSDSVVDSETSLATSSTVEFTDVLPGSYTVYVLDSNNCESDSITIEVPDADQATFTLSATDCYDGSNGLVTVNNISGNGIYEVSLVNASGTVSRSTTITDSSTVTSFGSLLPDTYIVTVEDSLGCLATCLLYTSPSPRDA